eukprot:TRINITY_DN24285_c0_g1_i1.p1 TRINITY_DN24285_c0_g1~~TRINITY_DN24285_c0_g1_i1.p1  ORF type:complete len:160 (-),score=20.70 TRINITY_DN24285_c0_g1_i1:611-1090(-)
MLGAGFFATSKSQEVTYSGIKQTTSNAVLDGYIYGSYSATMTVSTSHFPGLQALTFYVKAPEGGETLKLDQIAYLFAKNAGVASPVIPTKGSGGSLAPGARTKIVLDAGVSGPVSGSTFSIEIKPRVGASSFYTSSPWITQDPCTLVSTQSTWVLGDPG